MERRPLRPRNPQHPRHPQGSAGTHARTRRRSQSSAHLPVDGRSLNPDPSSVAGPLTPFPRRQSRPRRVPVSVSVRGVGFGAGASYGWARPFRPPAPPSPPSSARRPSTLLPPRPARLLLRRGPSVAPVAETEVNGARSPGRLHDSGLTRPQAPSRPSDPPRPRPSSDPWRVEEGPPGYRGSRGSSMFPTSFSPQARFSTLRTRLLDFTLPPPAPLPLRPRPRSSSASLRVEVTPPLP